MAKAYTGERRGFGGPLSEKRAIRHDVAEAETRLHAVRTMVRDAAARIDRDEEARVQVATSETFAANTVQEIVDTALRLCGGNGIGKDLPIADFYESVRQFHVVDGADEVHRRVITRGAFEGAGEGDELANVTRHEE